MKSKQDPVIQLSQFMSSVRWESSSIRSELLLLREAYVPCKVMLVHWNTQHMAFRLGWTEDKNPFPLGFLLPLNIFLLGFCLYVCLFSHSDMNLNMSSSEEDDIEYTEIVLTQLTDFKPSMAQGELILSCTENHKIDIKTKHNLSLHFSLLV